MVAAAIVVGIILHAGPHTACNIPRILHASNQEYLYIQKFFGEHPPPSYWWFLKQTEGFTGVWMIILMVIAIPWAMPSLRRKQLKVPGPFNMTTGYNSFWYTHHLFFIVYVLYAIHGYRLFFTHIWYEKTVSIFATKKIYIDYYYMHILIVSVTIMIDMDVPCWSAHFVYIRTFDTSVQGYILESENHKGDLLLHFCRLR